MQSDVAPGTALGDELEILSLLVHAYETVRYPLPKPHPIEAIRFRLDQMGLSEADLSRILGSRSRKSEILSGQRKLSLPMISKVQYA
jgi:HTH-type transcriptional regulator/antitoxin HigA